MGEPVVDQGGNGTNGTSGGKTAADMIKEEDQEALNFSRNVSRERGPKEPKLGPPETQGSSPINKSDLLREDQAVSEADVAGILITLNRRRRVHGAPPLEWD